MQKCLSLQKVLLQPAGALAARKVPLFRCFLGCVWWSLLPRSLVGSVPACAHQLALSLDPRNPCRGSAGLRWQMEQADPLSLRMPPPQAAHGHRPLPVTTLTPSVTLGGRERSLGAPARMCCCVCVRSVRQPSRTHTRTPVRVADTPTPSLHVAFQPQPLQSSSPWRSRWGGGGGCSRLDCSQCFSSPFSPFFKNCIYFALFFN